MNPFTDSTVARPLLDQPCPSQASADASAGKAPVITRKKTRRGLFGLTLCAMGLATSLGLAPTSAHAVDINTATLEQLLAVRGIGPKTAQIILEERKRAGKFDSFDDLSERVKGIGPKKAASLQASGLTLGSDRTPDVGKMATSTQR